MSVFTVELADKFDFSSKATGAEAITFDLRDLSIAGLRYCIEYGLQQSISDSFAGAQNALEKWAETPEGAVASAAEQAAWKRTWARDRAVARFASIRNGLIVLGSRAAGPDPVRVAALVDLLAATPALAGSARRPAEVKKMATAIATAAVATDDASFSTAAARQLVEATAAASLFAPAPAALDSATAVVSASLSNILARLRTPAPAVDLGALLAGPPTV